MTATTGKKRLYIPIETQNRELDGKLLLAVHMLSKEYEVVISSRGFFHNKVQEEPGIAILFKSVSVGPGNSNIEFYKHIKSHGGRIFLMDVEGTKNKEEVIRFRYPEKALKFLDLIFVFGESIKEKILELYPQLSADKIVVSGAPRFDLLKPRYSAFFQEQKEKLQAEYGSFFQINSSFTRANPYVGAEKFEEKFFNLKGTNEQLRANFYALRDLTTKLFENFQILIERLAATFPDHTVLIRPHPSESVDFYTERYKGFDNIIVKREGNVHNWLHAAKKVIHADCTTGFETFMLGKEPISYLPALTEEEEKHLHWIPIGLSRVFRKEDDLIQFLQTGEDGPKQLSVEMEEKVKGFIINITNISSPEVIAQTISTYLQDEDKHPFKLSLSDKSISFAYRLNYRLFQMRKNFRKRFKLKPLAPAKPKRDASPYMSKFGNLSLEDNQSKMSLLAQIIDLKKEVQVELLDKEALLIKVKA